MSPSALSALNSSSSTSDEMAAGPYRPFFWGGLYRLVPESFKFPNMPVKQLWNRWWCGDPASGIQPYKNFGPKDMASAYSRSYLSRCNIVMREMKKIAEDDGILLTRQTATDERFDITFRKLMQQTAGGIGSRRIGEIKLSTVYANLVTETNLRRRNEAAVGTPI